MMYKYLNFSDNNIFSFLFIAIISFSLFYTGNNVWLFSASFILITFSFLLVLKQRFSQKLHIELNGILISSTLLLGWFAFSIFLSSVKYLSIFNFFWIGSLLIVFIIFTLNNNGEKIWQTLWPAILLIITASASYGLAQYYYFHVPSTAFFLNRNSLAALINLALIPASGYYLISKKEPVLRFLSNKTLSVILFLLLLTTFIITSRGGSLSLLFGYVIMIGLLHKHVNKQKIYSLLFIIFISFLLSFLSQYFISDLPSGFAERMTTLNNSTDAGSSRFIIWKSLLPLFNEMPWYGFGLGSLWLVWAPHRPANDSSAGFYAHNDYMQIMLEAGYPGIILLMILFIFILLSFIKTIKNTAIINRVELKYIELISLFSALVSFATHSLFTYNFYILPLLIITGIYLAKFNQLVTANSKKLRTLPPINITFKPITYIFCSIGIAVVISGYFLAISISTFYNNEAKSKMHDKKYQASNALFIKAQKFAPLMDNPYFSHADLLRRGANNLFQTNQLTKANSLIKYALENLDIAENHNPLRPQTHHIRGLIYKRNQPRQAILEFQKALKLDPRFLHSRIELANIYYNRKQLRKAIEVLYDGVNYHYPTNKTMLNYLQFFAKLTREAGINAFATHLEKNIKMFNKEKRRNALNFR